MIAAWILWASFVAGTAARGVKDWRDPAIPRRDTREVAAWCAAVLASAAAVIALIGWWQA